jgi:TolB-like protein
MKFGSGAVSSEIDYKGKETDVAQIAKELEVDAVMSGRLVQRGDDLSISVQLMISDSGSSCCARRISFFASSLLP